MIVDSHCHLNCLDLTNYETQLNLAIERAKKNDVSHMLCVAIDWEHLDEVLSIAVNYPDISASVGVHPNENETYDPSVEDLINATSHPKVVAIGETGLDYYRTPEPDLQAKQHERFRRHIQAAIKTNLPLIIHMRDADNDTMKILKEENAALVGGVMHCFSSTMDIAKLAMEMNFYISFSGVVTFKNAKALQLVAKEIPKDRLLIETDAPYLAPTPHRGKSNEPAYLHHTAKFLADLRGVKYEEFAATTTHNYFNLFKLSAK